MAVFCFLLSPHYDTLLYAIDGRLFYFQVSYAMKAVHSFASSGGGGDTNWAEIKWAKKNVFLFLFILFLEITVKLEDKDWC